MSKKTNAGSGHRKDKKMKIRVQVIVESDDGVGEMIQEIAQLERGQLRPEELGLTLAEAKGLLEGLQRTGDRKKAGEMRIRLPISVTDRSQITNLPVDTQILTWRTTWRNLPSIFLILHDFDYLPRFFSVSK
jgi:hypothetical protein